MKLLTSSSLRVARTCLRKYLWRYVQGFTARRPSEALEFGTAWHKVLEAWWEDTKPSAEPRNPMLAADAALQNIDINDVARAQLKVLSSGYDLRWGKEPLVAVCVEQEFRTRLRVNGRALPGWTLAGKIDLIAKDEHGQLHKVEHKTTSEDISAGSDYWRKLTLDGQLSIYMLGARALGYDVGGCIYDVVKKIGLKPKLATPPEKRKVTKDGKLYAGQRDQDETMDEYYQRIVEEVCNDPINYFRREYVVRLESELEQHVDDLVKTIGLLNYCERRCSWPRNPEACVDRRYGSLCEFYDVCTGTASLEDEFRFNKLENVHPELTP